MKWPLTFYSDRTLENWQGGATRGPVIVIREKYRTDEGLYQHELTHVKQWFLTFFTFGIWYSISKTFRAHAEAQAYAKQMQYLDANGGSLSLDLAVFRLWHDYKLDWPIDRVMDLIDKYHARLTSA